ncbi:TPA: HNH endonuclease [Stenotrophomonas maltophilia]|nr:HNH endonuclease [Stenotrophomonas maltophilia]
MIWKEVPLFNGRYEASECGKIRVKATGQLKSLRPRCGYLSITAYSRGVEKNLYVHRMVALAFLPKTADEVNHKNGVKTDNSVGNLEWISTAENIRHAKSVLEKNCTPVIATPIAGGTSLRFFSMKEACRRLGVSISSVSLCVRGKQRSSHGWTFRADRRETREQRNG